MIEEQFDALGKSQFGQLARELGVEQDAILAARDFIRSHLRPYPITEPSDLEPWAWNDRSSRGAPDVIVRMAPEGSEEEFLIEIVESRRYHLDIDPMYREMEKRVSEAGEAARDTSLSEEDRAHILSQIQRAQDVLSHVAERRSTMRKVARYIVGFQRDFVLKGPRHMLRLTKAHVAEAIGVHESTVSRATKDKFVMLPNRQVVPFADFFKAALPEHDILREIVENEDKSKPFTDDQLARKISERGFPLARRTVAKYRGILGIPPAKQRRAAG